MFLILLWKLSKSGDLQAPKFYVRIQLEFLGPMVWPLCLLICWYPSSPTEHLFLLHLNIENSGTFKAKKTRIMNRLWKPQSEASKLAKFHLWYHVHKHSSISRQTIFPNMTVLVKFMLNSILENPSSYCWMLVLLFLLSFMEKAITAVLT